MDAELWTPSSTYHLPLSNITLAGVCICICAWSMLELRPDQFGRCVDLPCDPLPSPINNAKPSTIARRACPSDAIGSIDRQTHRQTDNQTTRQTEQQSNRHGAGAITYASRHHAITHTLVDALRASLTCFSLPSARAVTPHTHIQQPMLADCE